MFFTQAYDIFFADQRFSAGINVKISAQIFSLCDNAVDLIEGQIQLMAVFSRPASGTVKIAGRGRIQKNRPRRITVVLLTNFLLPFPADEIRIENKVRKEFLYNAGIHIFQHMHDELIPVRLLIGQRLTKSLSLLRKAVFSVAGKPVHHIQQFYRILLGIMFDVIIGSIDCK